MTAQTAGRNISRYGSDAIPDRNQLPMKAATRVFQGSLVVLNAGYAAPGTAALNLVAAGVAQTTVDNTAGANGDLNVDVESGVYPFANSSAGDLIGATEVGLDVYIVDDQTVAKTNGTNTRSRAGKCIRIENGLVYVLVGLGL